MSAERLRTSQQHVALIGPTSLPWSAIAAEVSVDLDRLRRPGLVLSYHVTGAGPASIRTAADARAAAPHVVATAMRLAREGVDAIIVDCTEDTGVHDARRRLELPIVGPGEALRAAVAARPGPVLWLAGEDLRTTGAFDRAVVAAQEGVRTIALGATGFSDLAQRLQAAMPSDVVVLEPLSVALASWQSLTRRPTRWRTRTPAIERRQ